MSTLLVRKFGPINNNAEIIVELHKTTVFCGPQGAGKSTLAKLISLFTWLEKALFRGDFLSTELTNYDRFRKKYCAYHNLQNFFRDETYICFKGEKYYFEYSSKHLNVTEYNGHEYRRPQVAYIPAERNFMAAIEDAEKIKRLPESLVSMTGDYVKSLKSLKGSSELPVSGYSVHYDKLNKVTWLVHGDSRIRIQEAASGFQSLIPLILVSRHLLNGILDADDEVKDNSSEERERLQKSVQSILKDNSLTEDVRRALILELNVNQKNHFLVNIVEEPEQNLYPASQRAVLYELLRVNNALPENTLVLTTHSPYLISYLGLAVKAHNVLAEFPQGELPAKLQNVIPLESIVHGKELAIYELTSDGEISLLPNYKGMPDDDNMLNLALADTADLYEQLVDFEESCSK